MEHWFMPRLSGKTTQIIKSALENHCDILVATSTMAVSVLATAIWMGIPGKVNRNRARGPLSVGDLKILIPADLERRDGLRPEQKPLLIDELDAVIGELCHRRVIGYSVTYPDP